MKQSPAATECTPPEPNTELAATVARARLRVDVAKQSVRLAKEELKRARKRFKEAKREVRRARKRASAARKAWKQARRTRPVSSAAGAAAKATKGRRKRPKTAVKAAAQTFRTNPKVDVEETITELAVGEITFRAGADEQRLKASVAG